MAEKSFSISLKMFRFVSQHFKIMTPEIVDLAGYAASFFIVLSFALRDIRQIRIVNLLGCVLFVIYGVFSGYLWPVIIPNGILCGIQLYQLFKLGRTR